MVSPSAVFKAWVEPMVWPTWDPEVKRVEWDGQAALGKRGKVWPAAGPPAVFAFTEIVPDQRVVNESVLPGGRIVVHHEVTPVNGGARASVVVGITGPLAPLWALLLRKPLGTAAPCNLDGLTRHLENNP